MAADILEACTINLHGDFDSQVRNLLESVRLTRHEVQNLQRLFYDLEETLGMFWPGCEVMPFGSIVTGLGIRTSDADCYVSLPEHLKRPGEKYVMTAKSVLQRRAYIFQQLFAIKAARVPIVKFLHAPTQCHCDVNFNSPAGVRNSKLIGFMLQLDERALPFAIILKYWSKVHKLTGTNLVPNYAFTMMCIFFLQQMNILPSVFRLQQNVNQNMVEKWNTAFNENYKHKTNNNRSLYGLLGGFFEYYTTYRYSDNIISPYAGYSVDVNLLRSLDLVPNEFQLYKEYLRNKNCVMIDVNCSMCVQDPFEHSRNSSMAVHRRLFHRFMCYLHDAAEKFKHSSQDTFLKSILDPSSAPPIHDYDHPARITTPRPKQNKRIPNRPNRRVPNRPNKVTKPTNRNNFKNVNLHALYDEANRRLKHF